MNSSQCGQRAKEESNIRRSQGFEYSPVVQGVGAPWDIGQFVNVNDTFAGVTGIFLIKDIEYSIDLNKGTRTRLTMTTPDAYQVVAAASPDTERIAETGEPLMAINHEPTEFINH